MSGLVGRYRAERLPVALLAMVSMLLAVAAQLTHRSTLTDVPSDAGLALLLFVICRSLDDIADRGADRLRHPERVLTQASSVAPLFATLAVLACAVMVVLTQRGGSWPVLLAFLALIALAGASPAWRGPRSLARDHLLLAKYPAIVWILTASRRVPLDAPEARVLLGLAATYLAACVYEAAHDAASPAAARPGLVVAEGLLLVSALTALSLGGHA
ncbi:MAG: hypothetical protein ABIX28_03445 [Vicinamibacterales bacterium]